MSLTGDELTDEVQALLGRGGDTVLCDDTRVARWLNEGQRVIAQECPDLLCLQFDNTATHTCVTSGTAYSIAEMTTEDPTSKIPCFIHDIFYMDGANSYRIPFVHTDVYDEEYTDLTDTDYPLAKPARWTRRGQNIEMWPLTDSGYSGNGLRFVGTSWPEDFTTNDTGASDLSKADDGLILYGVAQGWQAIGIEEKYILWRGKFDKWLEEYRAHNDTVHGWPGNLYDDGID